MWQLVTLHWTIVVRCLFKDFVQNKVKQIEIHLHRSIVQIDFQNKRMQMSMSELWNMNVLFSLAATADDSGVLGYCWATYDYSAMEPNQLSLRHGDRVAIVSKACANRGWWRGRLNGKVIEARNLIYYEWICVWLLKIKSKSDFNFLF